MASEDTLLSPRQPGRFDAGEDQQNLPASAVEAFRRRLRARHPTYSTPGFFASCSALFEVHDNSDFETQNAEGREETSFPLSLFDTGDSLPSADQLRRDFLHFTTHIQPILHFWASLPIQACTIGRRDVFLAAAAIGGLSTMPPAQCFTLWSIAGRLLIASTFMDNRLSHSKDSVLAWLLLETMSIVSSEAQVLKQVNCYQGFLYSIARNAFMYAPDNLGESWTPDTQTSLVLALLLSNTFHSLLTGVPLSAFMTFKRVSLITPFLSIEDITLTVVFGDANAPWPAASERSILLTILVLLNHIMLWAREHRRVTHNPCGKPLTTSHTDDLAWPQSTSIAWSSAMHRRLFRALARWRDVYFAQADKPVRALFHFCNLLLSCPVVEMLPDIAGYKPRQVYRDCPTEVPDPSPELIGSCTQDSHHAWSIIEAVAQCTGYCVIWVPSITYLAGLYIWYNLRNQGQSKSYGSLQVLRVPQQALAQMSWPCCETMAAHLGSLSDNA